MATDDDGRVHERVGWTPVLHFTRRSLLGLLGVVAVGLGFGLLLLLVALHWTPLQSLDRSVTEGLNGLVAPHPPVVTVLQAVSRLGGRTVMIWLVTVAVALLLIRRRTRLAVYLVFTGAGALALAVVMPLGVALSRMYRGMHHPTDMLGAGVLSACWITLLWFVLRPNADVGEGHRADAGEFTERDADRDLTEVPAR